VRLGTLLAACAAAVLIVAGCGGSKSKPTPTHTTSAAANTAYERAYSECASTRLVDLAARYNLKQNKNAIATAVARAWAKRTGGGADAVAAGKAGCKDGYAFEPK
jgi:ABC-type uncharacterized transport system auxiliary subunit